MPPELENLNEDGSIEITIDDMPPDFYDGKSKEEDGEKAGATEKASDGKDGITAEPEKKEPSAEDEAVTSLKAQLEALQKERDALNARVYSAEKNANDFRTRNEQSEAAVIASKKEAIDNAISHHKGEISAAKAAYQTAFEAGDGAAMADAQEKMSLASANLTRFEGAKADFEAAIKSNKEKPSPQSHQQPSGLDAAIDSMIQASSAKASAYIRKNRANLKSEADINKMVSGHYAAVADGHTPESDGYFSFIDTHMKWNGAGVKEESKKDDAVTKSKGAPTSTAAPVSREVPGGPANGETKITLSREQVEAAEAMGITAAQYAKNLLAIKNGKSNLKLTKDLV